ncbi:MAG: FAD-binding oxidoreductase, partial [Methyloligellaceae bacterium]
MEITEIAGWALVGAASFRGLISVFAFTGRRWRAARLDREYLDLFEKLAGRALKTIDTDRQSREQTWSGKRKFRIVRRVYENLSKDICSFYLAPYDNRPIPRFRPGQFLTFELPVPWQRHPVVRCYSLSDSPTERGHYRISIKRLWAPSHAPAGTPPGVSSNYFHEHLQEGDIVDVLAPAGEFCLHQESERPVVLVAGGVGLTPLISMLNALVASGSRREIWFFYGVRNRAEHAMYDHLARIRREFPNVRTVIAYSRPTETCRKGIDYDIEGHVSVELLKPLLAARHCEFYVCGPTAMMDRVTADLAAAGVAPEDIRQEAFGPATAKTSPVRDAASAADAGKTFRVEFSRSGKVVQWTKSLGTILELAEASGVKARCGCRAG